MGEVISLNDSNEETLQQQNSTDLAALTDELLLDVRIEDIPRDRSLCVPIGMLSTLGAGVSSLIPAFNTITQTTTVDTKGLYQIVNKGVEDTLKQAKDGDFWAAFKTPSGKSTFAKLREADSASATNTLVMRANPATMMMAVALYSVESELDNIEEMEKQILSFLEIEKESDIEADVKTLQKIISDYKHSWDNERYIASNHKLLCDIQRNARKNMISSQKRVAEALDEKHFIVKGSKLEVMLRDLVKKFKYYRLALYTFALASFAEIMLSGNFKQEHIQSAVDEIEKNSTEYRELFGKSSLYLEKLTGGAIELKVLKGVGTVSGVVGKLIGSIPKVKDGQVDEFLIEKGQKIKNDAVGIGDDIIRSFATVSNPSTGSLVRRMRDMDQIYNRTREICFDRDNLYLIAG